MPDDTKRTVIKLSDISDARSFSEKELIQKDAKKIFLELLDSLLKEITTKDEKVKDVNDEIERHHDTILIDGRRGFGKTSFALSMLKFVAEERKNIAGLGILDPTLIESKEHIFITIIAKIIKKIEEVRNEDKNKNIEDDYNHWKKSLNVLSKGLSLLDGVGSNNLQSEIWDAPELVLEEGLKNAKSGVDLENNFHRFIKESLHLLGRDAFLLFMDDIDTSVEKGLNILEILRKYLTCKRLIIVLLGDIRLYSVLARQLQWEKLDQHEILIKYENIGINKNHDKDEDYDDKNIYRRHINHLQDQYLVKIFKPQNRVALKNIGDYKKNIDIDFNGKIGNWQIENIKSLDSFLKEKLCRDIFYSSHIDIKAYENYIYSLPQRSFLQLLWLWDKYLKDNGNSNDSNQKSKNWLDFIINLSSMFVVYLQDMDRDDFTNMNDTIMNRLSIYLLERMEYLDDMYRLLPDYISDEYNAVAFFLSSVFAYYLQEKKEKVLEYFIKVGLMKKCFEEYKISLEDNKKNEDIDIANEINIHIKLDTNESAVDIAKKATAYFIGKTNPNPLYFGYIHIRKVSYPKNKKNIFFDIILAKTRYAKGGDYLYGSFFGLLGVISEILCIKGVDEIKNILLKYSEIPTFQSVWNSKLSEDTPDDENDNDDKDINDIFNDDNLNKLILAIEKWVSMLDKLEPVNIPLLHRIWTRFSSNIDDISEKLKEKEYPFNELLHRYIISFLNTVYIETILNREKIDIDKIIFKNSVIKDEAFNSLFKENPNKNNDFTYILGTEPADFSGVLDLFTFVYACPIWGVYLNNLENDKSRSGIYYLELQKRLYGTENAKEIYAKLHTKYISKEILVGQETKIHFNELNTEEQKKAATQAMSYMNTTMINNLTKPEIKDKYEVAIYKLSDILRYTLNYRKVPTKIVKEIVKDLLK